MLVDDAQQTWWRLYEAGVLAGTNGLLALSTAMSEQDIDEIGRRIITACTGG